MSLTRRALLQAAIALPLVHAPGKARGNDGRANIVGYGGFGTRLVRELAAPRAIRERHFCAVMDYESLPDRIGPPTLELLGHTFTRLEGPLIVVAGLGSNAGGELSRINARAFRTDFPKLPVRGVLVIPFEFEGRRRHRALEQAAAFDTEFGPAIRIDNHVMTTDGRELLSHFMARVDLIAIARVWDAVNSTATVREK